MLHQQIPSLSQYLADTNEGTYFPKNRLIQCGMIADASRIWWRALCKGAGAPGACLEGVRRNIQEVPCVQPVVPVLLDSADLDVDEGQHGGKRDALQNHRCNPPGGPQDLLQRHVHILVLESKSGSIAGSVSFRSQHKSWYESSKVEGMQTT